YGDVDGDGSDDAVVIIKQKDSQQTALLEVMKGKDPQYVSSVSFSEIYRDFDEAKINSFSIKNGVVLLDYTFPKANVEQTEQLKLTDGQLTNAPIIVSYTSYRNDEYGFYFNLPAGWSGYSIFLSE